MSPRSAKDALVGCPARERHASAPGSRLARLRWSSSALASSSSSSASRSPRGSATRAFPPATSRSSRTRPTASARSAQARVQDRALCSRPPRRRAEESAESRASRSTTKLKEAALGDLLDTSGSRARPRRRHLGDRPRGRPATRADQEAELPQPEAEYQEFLKSLRLHAKDDVDRGSSCSCSAPRSRSRSLGEAPPSVPTAEIEDYYDAAKAQFTTPETPRRPPGRSTKTRRRSSRRRRRSRRTTRRRAGRRSRAKYSTDPTSKSNGGLRRADRRLLEEPLERGVFDAAEGESRARQDASRLLRVRGRQDHAREDPAADEARSADHAASSPAGAAGAPSTQFVDDYGSKWQSRTFCAVGYVIERCANFDAGGHPPNAPAGLLRGRTRRAGARKPARPRSSS